MITNEDKINIVTQHLKNIAINEYNLELSLIEANAKSVVDQNAIDSITEQLSDYAAQKALLNTELSSLGA